MNKTIENILNTIFQLRWILITLFLLLTYRAIGLEGDQVLIGLTFRNMAWLLIAIYLLRKAIQLRKAIHLRKTTQTKKENTPPNKKPKNQSKKTNKNNGTITTKITLKILTSLCLLTGTILLASFLYLQSNVMLDYLVGPRDATLRECIVNPKIIPSWITGHDTELTGINENGYTKKLPLTPALTQRAYDELDRNKKVRVTFYEHVRRVIIMDKTEDILWHNIWQ